MADETRVARLRDLAAACTSMPIANLISRPAWGEITFEKAKPDLEQLATMVEPLKTMPIQILPDKLADQIANQITPIKTVLETINQFKISGTGNPAGVRDGFCNELSSHINTLYPTLTPHIPYLAYVRGDVSTNIRELSDAVTTAKSMLGSAEDYGKQKQTEVDDIIKAAREASASVGVAHFTADFGTAAQNQESSARRWLKATAWMAAATIVVALVFAAAAPDAEIRAAFAYRIVSKIAILALLFTATVWCGRMYKAAMHQASVNHHRANALKTFQAFTKAASDDSARDAVLMETTRSIFAHTQSGYLDGKDAGDGSIKVVEVVKAATAAAKAGGS